MLIIEGESAAHFFPNSLKSKLQWTIRQIIRLCSPGGRCEPRLKKGKTAKKSSGKFTSYPPGASNADKAGFIRRQCLIHFLKLLSKVVDVQSSLRVFQRTAAFPHTNWLTPNSVALHKLMGGRF